VSGSLVRLHPDDTVAIARRALSAGEEGAVEDIPRGHKMALAPVAAGGAVLKTTVPMAGSARVISSPSLPASIVPPPQGA